MVCLMILIFALVFETYGCFLRAILRRPQTVPVDWGTDGGSRSVDER